MNVEEVAQRINKPKTMVIGLANAGLLRKAPNRTIEPESVDSFVDFGCQWKSSNIRKVPNHISDLPPFIGSIAEWGNKVDREFWIALAFFKPNPLYNLPENALVRAGGTGIMMSEPSSCRFDNQLVYIYPDPSGELSTLLVMSQNNVPATYDEIVDSYTKAIKRVTAEISFRHDRYLHVVHSNFISLPSGRFVFEHDNFRAEQKYRELGPIAMKVPEELLEAKVLYSEAMSSNEPFTRFLLFFKSFELSSEVLAKLRLHFTGERKDKRKDAFLVEEKMPNSFPFEQYGGKGFGEVFQAMRTKYRNAVAHVGLDGESARAFSSSDRMKIRAATAPMYHLAKIRLINVDFMMTPPEVRPELGRFPPTTYYK